jgi:hypothetical protein
VKDQRLFLSVAQLDGPQQGNLTQCNSKAD